MMNGIARVINAYGDDLNDAVFKDKLSRVSTKELSRTAKDRRAGSLGYSEAMVIFYNKKNHRALPMEKLYAYKNRKDQTGEGKEAKVAEEAKEAGEEGQGT